MKRREVNLLLCLLFNVFILLFIIKFILPAGGPLYKLLKMKDYIYIYIYIYMHIYMCVCVCVCVFINIYIYIYIYIYIVITCY